jgi:hypothetical protein
MALGMNMAYPGGICMRLDHVQGGGGHPDRGVDVVDLAGRLDQPGHLHGVAMVVPPSISSSPQSRTPEGAVGPDGLAHGVDDLQQDPGPVASVPAVASVRLLVAGDRKPRTIDECEHCSSMPSKPPSHAVPGDQGVAGHDLGDLVRRSTALGTSRNSGSGTGLGAHTGSRVYMLEAWPPLWLIWAKIGTSCAWTASVMRR